MHGLERYSFKLPPSEAVSTIQCPLTVKCPFTNQSFQLPRTQRSDQFCIEWMHHLTQDPLPHGRSAKMYGVLLAKAPSGQTVLFKAYSGLTPPSQDRHMWGIEWAPAIPLNVRPSGEAQALVLLDELKERIVACESSPDHATLMQAESYWQSRLEEMRQRHLQNKQGRDQCRAAATADESALREESQRDAFELRDLRKAQKQALSHLRLSVENLTREAQSLRGQRKQVSRQLQKELHQRFQESLFPQEIYSGWFDRLFPSGARTGVGECCAPKLLHLAGKLGCRPLELSEFWWGEDGSRECGQFYPACQERCQPLLGPLMSCWESRPLLHYLDEDILVAEKPSLMLTVPGRKPEHQDCLWRRLQLQHPHALVVHRLDFEVSGLVLFALHKEAQAHLHRQWEDRSPQKIYTAILERPLACSPRTTTTGTKWETLSGSISRFSDADGRYHLDDAGRPAQTLWRSLDGSSGRVELCPLTGRSHQLRVHTSQLLANPIAGDSKYGGQAREDQRILLHATSLKFIHPRQQEPIEFNSPPPF